MICVSIVCFYSICFIKKYYCIDIEKKELKKVIEYVFFKWLGLGYYLVFYIYMLCVICFIFIDNVVF